NTDQDKENLFSLKHTEGHSSVFQILKLQNSGNKSDSFCIFEIKRGKIFCKLIRRCKKDDSCDKQKTPHTGRSSFHGLLIIFHLSILRIPSDSSVSVTVLSTKLCPIPFIRMNLICPCSIFLSFFVAASMSSALRPETSTGRPKSLHPERISSYS